MLVTPDEAKEMLCTTQACECLADRCMGWRWEPTGSTHNEERVVYDGAGGKRIVMVKVPDRSTHGYCGMAGRPGGVR